MDDFVKADEGDASLLSKYSCRKRMEYSLLRNLCYREVSQLYRILVMEDDADILELLRMNLQVVGYEVRTAQTGTDALRLIKEENFDLALLDIMVPEIDGFEMLPFMQKKGIPVIYVSAKNALPDRIRGLKAGAEDYLVKPFDMLELLVRVEKVLQRSHPQNRICRTVAGVEIDEASHTVKKDGEFISLKPLEYALMLMFVRHPGMVLTREQLLKEVWGEAFGGETRTVDVHVGVLRKKLGWNDCIVTVHRIGYKMEEPVK